MKNQLILFFNIWVSLSCFLEPVFGQSEELEKQVMTIEFHGKLVRAVPDEISIEYALQRMATESELRTRTGEMAALTEIRAEYLNRIQSRFEITDDQIKQLDGIRKEFASAVASLDVPDFARVNKLKLNFCDKVASVFLPSQVKALSNYTDTRIRILSRLMDDENIAGVDLSSEQKQKIQQACIEIQDPLEKILKRHQEELLDYRNKIKAICDQVLTDDQREKIRNNWIEHGRYIDYMSLENILDDVHSVK